MFLAFSAQSGQNRVFLDFSQLDHIVDEVLPSEVVGSGHGEGVVGSEGNADCVAVVSELLGHVGLSIKQRVINFCNESYSSYDLAFYILINYYM